jgi:hypothetical protein
MKKLTTLLALMAGAGFAFGQTIIHNAGVVSFQNTESAKTGVASHLVTNLTSGSASLLIGVNYQAELYYMDTTLNSLQPIAASISPFKASTTAQPGTWNGKLVSLPAGYGGVDLLDDGVTEAGDGSGTGDGYYPVTLAVRVWDINSGATWEAASVKGSSASFVYVQRFSAAPPPPGDTQMLRQPGFAVVPEPSAIALSIIGVAGLLLIRRRK